MKGQMIFEFMVAAVIFLAIIFYIITFMAGNMSAFSADYHTGFLESKAIQISEMLVKNPGVWAGPGSPVIGLADDTEGWPVLDNDKIGYLKTHWVDVWESDHTKMMETFDLTGGKFDRMYDVAVKVGGELECGRNPPIIKDYGYAKRYAVLDSGEGPEAVSVEVWVW